VKRSLVLMAILMVPAVSGKSGAQIVLRSARVVATSSGGDKTARPGIHRARLDEDILLFAAVEALLDGKPVVICAAEKLELHGKRVKGKKLIEPADAPGMELRWYKVQPTGDSYDNTEGGFHFDEIDYIERPTGDWGATWKIKADAHPIGDYPDTHGGAGTMAFKVTVRAGKATVSSPGAGNKFRGGLSDEVTRIAFRRDDSYVGRLTELFNTPYIWGSAGVPPPVHQAERLIGSDCADFIIYGARRLGKNLRYRASWHIPEVTSTVAEAVAIDVKGRYLTRAKKTIPIGDEGVQIGDLLLFRGHVGALSQDKKPFGVLDTNDIMIHTYWAPPAEEPVSQTAYSESALKVMRFE